MTVLVRPKRSFVYKSLRIGEYLLSKGEGLPKHEHTFNHLTICISGSCAIRKENLDIVLTPSDNAIDLSANEWHEIEALEDNTIVINME